MMRRVKLVTINMVIIRGASSFLSSMITVIILMISIISFLSLMITMIILKEMITKRMTLSKPPEKGLIVIFDY